MNTKKQIKYSYLVKQFADSEHILNSIRDELKKCEFTLGPEVEKFEGKFAEICKVKYAVGVGTGTDALFLSMKALGISNGDEVITVPNTFIATVGAIVATGAKPVFVDSDQQYNINTDLIEKVITNRTKAIVPVHYAGNPADMSKILKIARKYNLYVVEDACQAITAAINNKPVGSFGITGCFSLHPLKNLNVWGDGGVAVTNSTALYKKLILLRNHGLKNRDEISIFGYNSRLDTLQAIVANHIINDLDRITDSRIKNAGKLDRVLSEVSSITIPPRSKEKRHVYHIYIIQAKNRDNLFNYLLENGIEAKIHYPIPLHLQQASNYLGYKKGDFPVCEAQSKSIISLPVHQDITDDDIEYMVDKIREFYKK